MIRLTLISFFLGSRLLLAHEDPHDVIDTLTHQLEHAEAKDKAEIYFKRAVEYRISGQKQKAVADFFKYTKLMPDDYLGWLELGRMQDGAEQRLIFLTRASIVSDSNEGKAQSHYSIAECYYTLNNPKTALKFCQQAIQFQDEKNVTPLLFKSHLLWKLGELEKRVDFLSEVKSRHKSVLIERAWIDAKIDAGQVDEVKAVILKEMEESRFKSSWQIRAALCEAAGSDEAKEYAELAIKEIDARFNSKRPDVTLLMDLARAYSITGDRAKADVYLKQAKAKRYDPWGMAELEQKVGFVKETPK